MRRFYLVARDLHLYFVLSLSPFILVFSVSVTCSTGSRSDSWIRNLRCVCHRAELGVLNRSTVGKLRLQGSEVTHDADAGLDGIGSVFAARLV